jgi:hypothetical protein
VLIGEKTSGVHPGFRARDARGETWFIELDPKSNPDGATAAVTIATKLFWALGYNQVEFFLSTFDPKLATIDPKARVRRPSGARTPFTLGRPPRDPRRDRAQRGRDISHRGRTPDSRQDPGQLPL